MTLTVNFSGTVAAVADAGLYNFAVGQKFDGAVMYDPALGQSSGFVGANVQVNNGSPPIQWPGELVQLQVTPSSLILSGNPIGFFGHLTLNLNPSGEITGGSLGLNSETGKGNGSFSGRIMPSEPQSPTGLRLT